MQSLRLKAPTFNRWYRPFDGAVATQHNGEDSKPMASEIETPTEEERDAQEAEIRAINEEEGKRVAREQAARATERHYSESEIDW